MTTAVTFTLTIPGRSRRVSGSSEDTTSRLSTTLSLSQADSEHDMITLEEFLHESNRSPASRVCVDAIRFVGIFHKT